MFDIEGLHVKLARLEHEQWKEWATALMESEELSPERIERWTAYLEVEDWDDLPEDAKRFDLQYAGKILDVFKEHMAESAAKQVKI